MSVYEMNDTELECPCFTCFGAGKRIHDDQIVTCDICNGTGKQNLQAILAEYFRRKTPQQIVAEVESIMKISTGAGTRICRHCRGLKEWSRTCSNLCRSCDYGGTKLCLVCRKPAAGDLCELHAADERSEVERQSHVEVFV